MLAAVPVQGHAQPVPAQGRHRRLPALDDGRAGAMSYFSLDPPGTKPAALIKAEWVDSGEFGLYIR